MGRCPRPNAVGVSNCILLLYCLDWLSLFVNSLCCLTKVYGVGAVKTKKSKGLLYGLYLNICVNDCLVTTL